VEFCEILIFMKENYSQIFIWKEKWRKISRKLYSENDLELFSDI